MSLTYATLQTQIAAYLKRDDLASYFPSFITMAENQLNARLKVIAREQTSSPTLTSGTDNIAASTISASYGDTLRLWKTVNNVYEELVYLDQLQFLQQRQVNSGQPNYYTVVAATGVPLLYFDRLADANYTIYVQWRKKFALAADSSNWLSVNHEEVYLYAALVQSMPFIKNDPRMALWKDLLEEALQLIEEEDAKLRATMNTRLFPEIAKFVGYPSNGGFNINTG